MQVKLNISPDTEIKVEQDTEGNVIGLDFVPTFAKRTGTAILAYGAVYTDNGVLVDRFSLTVSGSTGKVTKTGRVESVKAAIDEVKPVGDVQNTATENDTDDEA